ncbi:MAG: hypothetical protein MPEBLZ_02942 [Candidatus Methanoperedens nitroreducens]|uniref:DUF1673 family protein n=1 Tax=Candidatus Methanoperedens nitratireducens TaxID=1392998 RepID=A0A0P7ZFX0_9EURY|nr:hypothetical protein [Candidatus Methanoperedens sp. BLZ2]KAB2944900.1 MAG: hypothetical protein F9K14_12735 [Candidatus Methanoperedens sp.]KPQ42484.1 MAG: hypothetical protein MPEBLZ_02942 [Candidatus Methanoperedens sp. BLZ1]MBZ0173776.1 hypothetical protein [Candidatus Methanoperedens nitroreducens]MCX9078277.1 hypothetical protein [Candidatus Methanoperedens sp.]
MTAFIKNIRKIMGWCPQEKIVYRSEDEFISDYASRSKIHTNNNSINEDMDVPLQMFDWRIWAIILGFAGLIIIGSAWAGTYRYFIPVSSILIALLIVFFHTKLSIGSETLKITTPILGDTVIPKSSIKSIEIFENYGNRHKLRSLVSLVVMILLSIYFVVAMPDSVMNILFLIAIFGFAYTLYATIRISNYPDMIRMNAGGRYILLYPRNEHDFLKLKYIVQGMPGCERRKE